jgi:hypothetical protein
VLQESPWTRPDATVWIVGFNDRMYLGTDQLPTPVSRDPQTRVHRFHGLFLVEMHGGAPAAQRLADGIALIADHLPDGRAVTAPLLFRGRYLLAQGDRTAAAACFEAARRQCRSEVEANTLLERFVPREARSLLVAVSHPRSEPSERRSMLKERAEVSE